MPKRTLLLGLAVCLLGATAALAVVPTGEHAYEVPVSMDMAAPSYQQLSPAQAAQALPGWSDFTSAQGQGWIVAQYRQALGTPSTLMGPGIPLIAPGSSRADVADAATRFVARQADVLKCDPTQLGTPEVMEFFGRTQVLFGQTYQGLEVVGGRVELMMSDGKVVLMGSEFYPGISVGTVAGLSQEAATQAAIGSIPFNPVTDQVESTRLVVYPMILQGTPEYFLAYEVKFRTQEPVGYWWTYVDASDGEVLSRMNLATTYDIATTVINNVHPNYAQDPQTAISSEFEYVGTNGQTFYTDANGFVNLTVPQNQSYSVTSELRGHYSNVNRYDGADASWSGSGTPGTPLQITWTDANSHMAERDAYYSHNRVHDWVKAVDPGWTSMDYMMGCNVNIDTGTCNAYWNGSSINFYKDGGGCVNMATISDVVMHEYGHAITQWTYSPNTPPNNSGMGEGFSDIVAMTITNDSVVGRGIHDGSGFIRDGMNQRQYPGTECGGEVHCLGEIIMGAMWKTRVNLINTYGYEAGVDLYDQIWRGAWKTKQYSMPNFLTRLLMMDDDNANLGDGTPDWYDICDAFALHNLPCPALTQYISFTHTPLGDQESTTTPYQVVSGIQAVNCGSISSAEVHYTIDNGDNWLTAAMTPIGGDQYRAYIPPQACGTVVSYYLWAESSTGVLGTAPLRAPGKGTYKFMTGPAAVALDDDFESDLGWTVGAPGDEATDGIWQRVDPVGKTDPYNGEMVQPEDDHTPAPGVNCYVTDGSGGYYLNHDVDGGATTILSPVFDLSGTNGAVALEFWAFFANETVVDDTLRASVSNDGGDSWLDLVKIYGRDANAWNFYAAYFNQNDIAFTDNMRFRIQIADYNSSLTEGAVDDLTVRYTTCSGTSVGDGAVLPASFAVEGNRPNPVRTETSIRFALPRSGRVSVDLFDAGGRLVRNLASGTMDAGEHSVTWDGRDGFGRPAASGVYYYRVSADSQQQTRKLLVIR